jgi:hypothetical protein
MAALFAAAGLILVPLSASAQATPGAASGFQIMSFDIGYAPAWKLDANDFVAPALFALNVRVANNFVAGFETLTSGALLDRYLTMKYSFLPMVRGTIAFGRSNIFASGGPAMGLGFEAIPFTRTVAGSVSTEFKLAFQYLASIDDLSKSGLVFALGFGVGI